MRRMMAWMLFGLGLLTGCASHVVPLAADGTALISAGKTANLDATEARRAVLIDAARITVDHGMQYFQIVKEPGSAIRPGADVVIKVYPAGSISPNADGVWDAQKILTLGVPEEASARMGIAPAPASAPPQNVPRSAPRCTAYGCDW